MCTFSPWNPLWAVIARRCATQPGMVWAVVTAIRDNDGMLALLKPHDRVQVLAHGLGIKPVTAALVVAALEVAGVVIGGRIAEAWLDFDGVTAVTRDDVTLSRSVTHDSVTSDNNADQPSTPVTETKAERIRRLARDRQRRRRQNLRSVTSVTAVTLPSLEEKEQQSLFPSDAREAVKPPGGWGVQAELDKKAKADRWLSNVLAYAQVRMSQSDYARLCEAALLDERPRWAQAQLDEWSRRMKSDRPPDRRQREILMPISNAGGNNMQRCADALERFAARGGRMP